MDKKGIKTDDKGKFVKGTAPGPGRPEGSISIKDTIRKNFKDNPEKFEELISYYMENEQPIMRKLLWEMLEGKPAQQIDLDANVKTDAELTDAQLERILRGRADRTASGESS